MPASGNNEVLAREGIDTYSFFVMHISYMSVEMRYKPVRALTPSTRRATGDTLGLVEMRYKPVRALTHLSTLCTGPSDSSKVTMRY